MPYNKTYPIKVWAACIVLGPIVCFVASLLIQLIRSGFPDHTNIGLYISVLIYALVFSLPTFAISYLFYRYLITTNIQPIMLKLLMFLTGQALFILTLKTIEIPVDGIREPKDLFIHVCYTIPFILGTTFFSVLNKSDQ